LLSFAHVIKKHSLEATKQITSFAKKIEQLISHNRLNQALNEFMAILNLCRSAHPDSNLDVKDLKKQIILLSGRYHELAHRARCKSIDNQNVLVERNQISCALLEIIECISHYPNFEKFLLEIDENMVDSSYELIEKSDTDGLSGIIFNNELGDIISEAPDYVPVFMREDIDNEIDFDDPLMVWWNGLSFEWKSLISKKLNLNQVSSSSDLDKMNSIEKLDLSFNQNIRTLEPIRKLENLKNLNCAGTKVFNLSALESTPNLEILWCFDSFIDSLEPLTQLKNLKVLDCSNTQIKNLEPLRNLKNLEVLVCSSNQLSSIEPLIHLPSLKSLSIDIDHFDKKAIRSFKRLKPSCTVL